MAEMTHYLPVLEMYHVKCQPFRIERLGSAGGFSGGEIWRLETPAGRLCLRRWPEGYPTRNHLEFIQAVLWHVREEGVRWVPVPLETRQGRGYVRHRECWWELSPWMPGEANYCSQPSPIKLRSALRHLAIFHQAAVTFPLPFECPSVSPGIHQRMVHIERLLTSELAEIRRALAPEVMPGTLSLARQILPLVDQLAESVLAHLQRVAHHPVRLQPCIRDIWHPHVLYLGHEVSGLVDFGSMKADSVATDIARLLGSLAGDQAAEWQLGLKEYQKIRPLKVWERELVDAFDESSVLLSGVNWLDWIYRQGRQFSDPEQVQARLETNLQRLRHLLGERF